ncbi:MAG: formylglycine-generating enzyme family protein [Bacteroidota bacterium]
MSLAQALQALMLPIPAGAINLRDDRKKEAWRVQIAPFYLAKYPLTQDLYQRIMGENPSHFKGLQKPVECVSCLDAVKFCNQLSAQMGLAPYYEIEQTSLKVKAFEQRNGYRLPTEAEWQYACQAGTQSVRYGELDDIAWYKANAGGSTQAVGQKAPNAWGLSDMLGNVWEWCSDIYDEEIYGSYRVFRGGGYFDEARSILATNRRRSHPVAMKIEDLGFRIARNLADI